MLGHVSNMLILRSKRDLLKRESVCAYTKEQIMLQMLGHVSSMPIFGYLRIIVEIMPILRSTRDLLKIRKGANHATNVGTCLNYANVVACLNYANTWFVRVSALYYRCWDMSQLCQYLDTYANVWILENCS